jgi:hypothetical protein
VGGQDTKLGAPGSSALSKQERRQLVNKRENPAGKLDLKASIWHGMAWCTGVEALRLMQVDVIVASRLTKLIRVIAPAVLMLAAK